MLKINLLFFSYLGQVCQDLVALRVQDHEALVEVVVLHRRRRVQLRQLRSGFDLERIVGPAMVQIVTEASYDQRQDFHLHNKSYSDPSGTGLQGVATNLSEFLPPVSRGHGGEHHLCDVKGMAPVVIRNRSVIFPDADEPPAEDGVVDMEPPQEVEVNKHPQSGL